jgi:hypothetical protein
VSKAKEKIQDLLDLVFKHWTRSSHQTYCLASFLSSLLTYQALGEEVSLEAGGGAKEGADGGLGVNVEGGGGKVLEGCDGGCVAGLGTTAGRLWMIII